MFRFVCCLHCSYIILDCVIDTDPGIDAEYGIDVDCETDTDFGIDTDNRADLDLVVDTD